MDGNFPLFRLLFDTVKPNFGVNCMRDPCDTCSNNYFGMCVGCVYYEDNWKMPNVADGPDFWPVPDSHEMKRLQYLYGFPVSPDVPERQAGYDDELPF